MMWARAKKAATAVFHWGCGTGFAVRLPYPESGSEQRLARPVAAMQPSFVSPVEDLQRPVCHG